MHAVRVAEDKIYVIHLRAENKICTTHLQLACSSRAEREPTSECY